MAPALAGAARPGFIRQAPAPARLDAAGQPLARRTRLLRARIGRKLAGSGLIHALVLVLLSVMFAQQEGGKPQEQQAVDMLYDNQGSSGMTGPHSPEAGASPPAAEKLPDLTPPTPVPPTLTTPAVPEMPTLPELALPEPLPRPSPPTSATAAPRQVPLRQAPRSASPFANPMNLSFSQAPSHARTRAGRRSGSNGPMDLSLGPLVQNGRLLTPYASTSSIKGVSSDYGDEIGAWIRRHMYYPEDAAKRGEDGPSHVHVVLDRQGRVKSVRLVDSSGSYSLDDATQGMFRNAQLPPVPPDMAGEHFDVDLTIDYILLRQ